MHRRFTHLDYIALYYRLLNEILECDYIRSFVGLFFFVFFFFSSIVILHSPGSDGRPIRERERGRKNIETLR